MKTRISFHRASIACTALVLLLLPKSPAVAQDASDQQSVCDPDAPNDDDSPCEPSDNGSTDQPPSSNPLAPVGGDKPTVIDFGDEEAFATGDVLVTQNPTPLKHESLIRKKFRGPDPNAIPDEPLTARPASSWHLGVEVGPSVASFGGNDAPDDATRLGGSVGALLLYQAGAHVALQTGAKLSLKGALPDGGDDRVRLMYIDVPLTAKIVLPIGATQLSAGFGPSLGVALTSAAGDADIARLDIGVALDLGARHAFGATDWLLSVRYEHGMANVISSRSTTGDDAPTVHNRIVSTSIGYLF